MELISRHRAARTTATPAATMRTLSSATFGPAAAAAVWWTDLPADSSGPAHAVDVDHFVVVASGALDVQLEEQRIRLEAGDGLRLPAGVVRTIAAAGGEPARTLTVGASGGRAQVGDHDAGLVPWTV